MDFFYFTNLIFPVKSCCRSYSDKWLVIIDVFNKNFIKLFAFYGFEVNYRIQRGDWMAFRNQLSKTKRTVNGVPYFVLLKDQGEYEVRPVDEEIIKNVVMVPSV